MSLEHLVEKLAAFEPQGDLPVVSLYLNAQADEHGRHNFHTFVRKHFPERTKTAEEEDALNSRQESRNPKRPKAGR